jgi:hypothetical protein
MIFLKGVLGCFFVVILSACAPAAFVAWGVSGGDQPLQIPDYPHASWKKSGYSEWMTDMVANGCQTMNGSKQQCMIDYGFRNVHNMSEPKIFQNKPDCYETGEALRGFCGGKKIPNCIPDSQGLISTFCSSQGAPNQ